MWPLAAVAPQMIAAAAVSISCMLSNLYSLSIGQLIGQKKLSAAYRPQGYTTISQDFISLSIPMFSLKTPLRFVHQFVGLWFTGVSFPLLLEKANEIRPIGTLNKFSGAFFLPIFWKGGRKEWKHFVGEEYVPFHWRNRPIVLQYSWTIYQGSCYGKPSE